MFTNLAIERGPHIVDMIGIVLGIISRDHIIKKNKYIHTSYPIPTYRYHEKDFNWFHWNPPIDT